MVNYQLGKIYKIVCNTTGIMYIGSTCEANLARRLSNHKSDFKRWKEKSKNVTASCEVIENNNYEIILIENYPCNSKDELHARERFFIENNHCVNRSIPTRTMKEYDQDNKERIRETKKIYFAKNKQKIKEYQQQWYEDHKETVKAQNKIWCQENKERRKVIKKRCYDKKKSSNTIKEIY